MQILTLRCLRDNFAYLIVDDGGDPDLDAGAEDGARGPVAVVDPGEAAPVLAALAARGLRLQQVWATHHHPDHVGGVRGLRAAFPALTVIAHARDAARVTEVTGVTPQTVEDGDVVALGSLRASVLHNPGHTLGAISYLLPERDGQAAAVFTGDTLFGAGCGRLFEGDAAMMHASLSRLAALPATTRVYFGHEYTRSNLRFAEAVAAGAEVTARQAAVEQQLAAGADSTPSTIAQELATNPFLRCATPAAVAAARARGSAADSPAAVFAALRAWKDAF